MNNSILSKFPKNDNKNLDDGRKGPQYFVPVLMFTGACLIAFLAFEWRIIAETADFLEAEPAVVGEPILELPVEEIVEETEPEPERPIKPYYMTDDDIVAAVVMSEAGNQDLLGKTAVAATVYNRADYFGLTVEQVVSAEGAYSWPYYGVITEDCYRAVEIAKENRDLFPSTMMWFKTQSYHTFADDYNKIGDHYFSCLKEGAEND